MDEKRILVVDDDPLIRRALADYLAECGYETVTAADGAEALAQARAGQFHAVLVDLRMPHVSGLQVIATLHAEQPALPVVAVSGTGVLAEAIAAMRQGAWDYVTKPLHDMDEVAVVVERVLERARLTAERDLYQRELEELNRSLQAEVTHQTQDLQVQNRELAALNRVAYAISASLDLDTMLHRAIHAAVAAVEADGGVVRLLNPAAGVLAIAATCGLPPAYVASAKAIPLGQGVVGQVAQTGNPGTGHDLASDPWLAPLTPDPASRKGDAEGFQAYLCVPLRAGDETTLLAEMGSEPKRHPIVGTLGIVMQARHEFDAREVELLAAIGNLIGVAVARAQYAADLKQANVELECANANLRRLDVLREQFIQNVAHELRTPLALVHGYVAMLAQAGDLDRQEQRVAMDVVSRNVHVLVQLVEAITTLQDLDSRSLSIERIMPADLLQTACRMAAQRASTASIKLHNVCPPDLPPVPGDFSRLAQVLHQLLDNACKFSPKHGTVSVTAQLSPGGGTMCISVADQGIGIPPQEHERIFERFYQVDGSTTRRYGGTGLGLALVKEIVEAHGGTVTVHSAPGVGSTFTVSLPMSQVS